MARAKKPERLRQAACPAVSRDHGRRRSGAAVRLDQAAKAGKVPLGAGAELR